MALSMATYARIIDEGLADESKRRKAEVDSLLSAGVDPDEATRRVYSPWKTLAEYRAMCADYDRAFSACGQR